MKKIYRYQLTSTELNNSTLIPLPVGHDIIRVDEVDGVWSIWAIVCVDADTKVISTAIKRVQLPVQEKLTLKLPSDAKLLHARDIDGLFYLWYSTSTFDCDTERKLVFFKTGQEIPNNLILSPLIGTCKLFIMQELCLYVFEDLTASLENITISFGFEDEYPNPC